MVAGATPVQPGETGTALLQMLSAREEWRPDIAFLGADALLVDQGGLSALDAARVVDDVLLRLVERLMRMHEVYVTHQVRRAAHLTAPTWRPSKGVDPHVPNADVAEVLRYVMEDNSTVCRSIPTVAVLDTRKGALAGLCRLLATQPARMLPPPTATATPAPSECAPRAPQSCAQRSLCCAQPRSNAQVLALDIMIPHIDHIPTANLELNHLDVLCCSS